MSKYKCYACGRYFDDRLKARNHSCAGSDVGSYDSIIDTVLGMAIENTSSDDGSTSSDFGGGGHFGGGGSTDSWDSGSSSDSGSSDCGSSD